MGVPERRKVLGEPVGCGGDSRTISGRRRPLVWRDHDEVRVVAVYEVDGPRRRVAVIQLDVEGYDQQPLRGAPVAETFGMTRASICKGLGQVARPRARTRDLQELTTVIDRIPAGHR